MKPLPSVYVGPEWVSDIEPETDITFRCAWWWCPAHVTDIPITRKYLIGADRYVNHDEYVCELCAQTYDENEE